MHTNNGINVFTQNLITKGHLYFSRFSEQNDPNEAIFDYSTDVHIGIEDWEQELYPHFIYKKEIEGRIILKVSGRVGAEHIKRRIDSMYGILCLSEDPKNLLMFDYYGEGHKGICIGLDWEKLGLIYKSKEPRQHQLPRKIAYKRNPPLVELSGDNFNQVLFSKSEKYKHEKEFRLIYTPGIYKSPQNVLSAIKEIIFGCAISETDKLMVRSWIDINALKVNYYQTTLKPKSYALDIDPIKF
ncbi:DUF2971 domain-containing protein [Legionella sp. 29fVS95]